MSQFLDYIVDRTVPELYSGTNLDLISNLSKKQACLSCVELIIEIAKIRTKLNRYKDSFDRLITHNYALNDSSFPGNDQAIYRYIIRQVCLQLEIIIDKTTDSEILRRILDNNKIEMMIVITEKDVPNLYLKPCTVEFLKYQPFMKEVWPIYDTSGDICSITVKFAFDPHPEEVEDQEDEDEKPHIEGERIVRSVTKILRKSILDRAINQLIGMYGKSDAYDIESIFQEIKIVAFRFYMDILNGRVYEMDDKFCTWYLDEEIDSDKVKQLEAFFKSFSAEGVSIVMSPSTTKAYVEGGYLPNVSIIHFSLVYEYNTQNNIDK